MNLNSLKVKSFVTDLGSDNANTVKGGTSLTNTQPTGVCGGCDIATNDCGGTGPTTAGPGTPNTGWPPSQGCSNNSCVICHIE